MSIFKRLGMFIGCLILKPFYDWQAQMNDFGSTIDYPCKPLAFLGWYK